MGVYFVFIKFRYSRLMRLGDSACAACSPRLIDARLNRCAPKLRISISIGVQNMTTSRIDYSGTVRPSWLRFEHDLEIVKHYTISYKYFNFFHSLRSRD